MPKASAVTWTGWIRIFCCDSPVKISRRPDPRRTISHVVRADIIPEAKLNAVVDAVLHIIPGELLETAIRRGHLTL